jgi:amino acid transporter
LVVAFEVGWLLWLARLTAFAALCNLLVDYLGYFVPDASTGTWRVIVIVIVVGLLTIINIIGVRDATLFSDLFTIGKLIPLLLFVAIGAFFIKRESYAFGPAPNLRTMSQAILPLVFAFSGFETAVIPAGETLDPRRHLPFALIAGISLVALLYIAVQAVCIGTLPDLANSPKPLADAANRFVGSAGGAIIAIGAIVSVTGTLNSMMLAAPRLLFAMAEQDQLPRALASTHARFRTPHLAILASAAVMLVLTLNGSFLSQLTISTIIRLVAYGATCAALPVLRRQAAIVPAQFTVAGGLAVAVGALLLIVWLLVQSGWRESLAATFAALFGLLVFAIFRAFGRS